MVVIGEGEMADAKRRLVERAGGICCGDTEAHYASLAFVAMADPCVAEAAAVRLKSKGLLVNVADRPDLCDFTLPSVLERGPVVIAVGTGGASAGLAKQLRLRLEALLPATLGNLAEGLFAARQRLRERWPDAGHRRRALDDALSERGSLDPLDASSAERLEGWLGGAGDAPAPRTVEITLASGDPDDLTLGQARWLGQADAVVYDADVADAILARARADALRVPLASWESNTTAGLTVVLRKGR